jgi:hypothetical protein
VRGFARAADDGVVDVPQALHGSPSAPPQLMRNALLDLTTLVPTTAYHRRSYAERYSRYKVRNYNEALEKLGAEKEGIFQANMKALAGWNVYATLDILGTCGDRRAIGPIRHLLEMPEPVHTEAKAALKQLGASWYDQRSDAQRLGLWLGALLMGRALWRGCAMLWHLRRRSLPPERG